VVATVADYTPVFTGGKIPFTSQASATITGGQLVLQSGANTVAPTAGASAIVVGVAAHDAATGAKVTVWPLPGVTHEVISTGTIAAGAGIVSGAAGVAADSAGIAAAAAAGTLLGIAETGATGGALVRFIGR
jgi:hypothetical protein